MGLALVTDVRTGASGPVLEVDTGSNRYVRYSVGTGTRRATTAPGGWIRFDELEGISYESPIRPRPGTGALQTRTLLDIDPTRIDREHRHVQVTSFRSPDGTGPAWSRVVTVAPWDTIVDGAHVGDDGLPAFRRPTMSTALSVAAASTRSVPMSVRESSMSAAMDWSALLGLVDDLAPIAQQVLEFAGDEKVQEGASGLVKILGPLLQNVMGGAGAMAGGLFGGGAAAPVAGRTAPAAGGVTNGSRTSPSGAPPSGGSPSSPGSHQPVVLVQPAAGCPPGTVPACLPAPAPAPAPAPVPGPAAGVAGNAVSQPQSGRVVRAMAVDGGVISVPAILGIVSAVAPTVMKMIQPLVEKSPEMFQTYMDHPIKMINALADIDRQEQEQVNAQVDRLLGQGNQQLLLTMLNGLGQGGGANAATPGTLAGLVGLGAAGARPVGAAGTAGSGGLAAPQSMRSPASRRRRSVGRGVAHAGSMRAAANTSGHGAAGGRSVDQRIEAVLVPPAPVPGVPNTQSLYAAGGSIGLSLTLATPQAPPDRPLPGVVAEVRVTDAAKGSLVLERRVDLDGVHLNQPVDVVLDDAAVGTLPTGRDLTVSVDVSWSGRDGRSYTTPQRAVQHLRLVDGAFVAEAGHRIGEAVALSDPQRHRAFWHRIWEGGSASHSRWELNASARYYYTLAVDQPSNARMDTKFRAVDARSKDTGSKVEWGGLLKSGMELSPDVLNLLLDEMGGPDDRPWAPAHLAAMRSETVARSVATKAEVDLHLRGRTEERGAVWVFPVVSLVEFDLHEPTEVDGRGAVIATDVATRRFPLPVAAVIVGMENEG